MFIINKKNKKIKIEKGDLTNLLGVESWRRRGTSALEPLMKARRRFELEKKRRTGKQDVLREEEKNERNGA